MFNFFKKVAGDARHFPLGVKLIVFVLFLRSFGWGFVDPFFSMFVETFTASYTGVGTLISVMNLASLLAIIPLARLADRVQDTVIMRDGEVLYLFSIFFYTLAAFTGMLPFLITAFFLNGLALPFVVVSAEAYIRRHGNRASETKSFALYTTLHYLGWILGMVLAGFSFQYYGFKFMFLFVLPGVIAGFFVLKRIREHGLKSILLGFRKYFHNTNDFRELYQDVKSLNKRTFFILILSFFDGMVVMFSFIFIPLYARSINLNFQQIAFLMAIMYTPFIFSFFISELTDRMRRLNVIILGLVIGGIAFVLMSLIVNHLLIAVVATMKSVSLAILRPAYNGMLTHMTPRRMLGGVTSLNNLSLRVGFIVGPILSGFIADIFSIQIAFFTIAIFAFALAIFTLIFRSNQALK